MKLMVDRTLWWIGRCILVLVVMIIRVMVIMA